LGILYYQQGQIAKADELLTKAIGAGSADPQTQYFLGLVRYSQNRNEEALRAFQQARTVQPNYEEAYFYSGETLARLRRFPEAITEYERATSLKPTYFDAFVGLGDAYYEVGRYADAVNAYKQAVKLKNDNPDVFENLADAYRQVGSFNEAEANYNLAALFLQRRPDYDKETLADIYNKTGFVIAKQCEINTRRAIPCRWTIAIDVLEKAANLAKTTIDNANLGWAYYNAARIDMTMRREADAKSKLERAKSNLLKAIALNPKFVDAPTLNLGVVYIDLGEYQNAINTLAPIVDKHPEWVFSKYALGTAYYKTNDFNSAAKYFKKAVDDEPSYVQALASLGYTELQRKNGKEVKRIVDRLRKLSQNEANKLESQLIASRLPT
jgi:tetratricopeptide (TPR) repeat protein